MKSNHDHIVDGIDARWKQWTVGVIGIGLTISGPIIAGVFKTAPGVAICGIGLLLIHLSLNSKGPAKR